MFNKQLCARSKFFLTDLFDITNKTLSESAQFRSAGQSLPRRHSRTGHDTFASFDFSIVCAGAVGQLTAYRDRRRAKE